LFTRCDLEVIPPDDGSLPKAAFTYAVTNDCASGCMIQFSNTSENAHTYEWEFGDESGSNTSSNKDPVHTYANPGSYMVTLRAFRNGAVHDPTMPVEAQGGCIGSENVFVHTMSGSGVGIIATALDHPLTNNNPDALLIVST